MFTWRITIPKFTELMILPLIYCSWLLITPIFHSLTSLAINIVRCFFMKGYAAHYLIIPYVWSCLPRHATIIHAACFALFFGVSVKDKWSIYTAIEILISVRRGKYEESGPLCSIHQTLHKICIASAYMSLCRMPSVQLIMTVKICHQDKSFTI